MLPKNEIERKFKNSCEEVGGELRKTGDVSRQLQCHIKSDDKSASFFLQSLGLKPIGSVQGEAINVDMDEVEDVSSVNKDIGEEFDRWKQFTMESKDTEVKFNFQ